MVTKRKITLTVVLFTILLLFGVLLFIPQMRGNNIALAESTSSAVYVTQGRVQGGKENGFVLSPTPLDNFSVTMEAMGASGTGTLAPNSTIDWTYVRIKVIIKDHKYSMSFRLEKDGEYFAGMSLPEKPSSSTLYEGSLGTGSYRIIIATNISYERALYQGMWYVFEFNVDRTGPDVKLMSDGKEISSGTTTNKAVTFTAIADDFKYLYYKKPGASTYTSTTSSSYTVNATSANSGTWMFYATDKYNNQSKPMQFNMNCTAPTLSCSGGTFGGTTEKAFTVTASKSGDTSKLYVKYESEEWFSTGSSYTVPMSERNGRYYFYAEDSMGNKTDTKWVILSTEDPVGKLVKSESDNSVSFVWDNAYWSATLDGKAYANGTWVADEGNHQIILTNNATKRKTYNFSIDHYFTITSQKEATCSENGWVRQECLQCGEIETTTVFSIGHKYNVQSTPATCSDEGVNKYICTVCGYTYSDSSGIPSGHDFTSRIKQAPTCTNDGIRENTCSKCGLVTETKIAAQGHSYEITNVQKTNGNTTRTYKCSTCGNTYKQELGNQYEEVSNYVEYLYKEYQPYMVWVFLATAGVWSVAIGVALIIAHKNEDKEKAKKMLVNYVIGLVVIFVILVAAPFLIRGIAALVT